MQKDFDAWNAIKKSVDSKYTNQNLYFHEREIWWCSIGLNIGVESDGKNHDFERPILILKKFNAEMIWALPLTGMAHNDRFHRKIRYGLDESWVCLTQIRTISTKRLLRKVSTVGGSDFEAVLKGLALYIKTKPPR